MNHIRRLDPVAQKQAEAALVMRLAEIGLLHGIRRCEELAGVPHDKRYHHRQLAAQSPSVRRTHEEIERADAARPFPTDEDLAASARAAIERSGLVSPGQITASVINGWLILEGEVQTHQQQQDVEAVARGVNGIAGVSNRLALSSETLAERVRQKIIEDFIATARKQAFRVQVAAKDQTIVLSGSARTEFDRSQAEAAALKVPGAAAVVNRIELSVLQAVGAQEVDLFR